MTESQAVMSHIDVTPTIMDVFGLPIPDILEGKSVVDFLKSPELPPNDCVFLEFTRYEIDHDGFGGFQPIRCCTDGRYKLVINLLESPEHRSIRDLLHNRILAWMNDTRDPFRGYYWERRPWRKDAAKATWEYTNMTRQHEHEEYEPRQLDYDTGLEMKEAIRNKAL